MADATTVVEPEGKASIEYARGLKQSLQDAFEAADTVVFSFEKVSDVDLTAIHLIYAARLHAGRVGKEFRLAGTLAPEVADAFVVGGFAKEVAADGAELEKSLVDFAMDGQPHD